MIRVHPSRHPAWFARILFLAAVTMLASGCAVEPVDLKRTSTAGEASHVCAGSCDHIFVDGGWTVIPRHRHGPECGHVIVDGKWVKAESKISEPPKDR